MITNFLVALWAAVAVTLYSVEFARLHLLLRIRKPGHRGGRQNGVNAFWYPLNRKPFNCEACLPVWLFAVFFHLAIYGCSYVAFVACAFTAGILTPMILKLIRR